MARRDGRRDGPSGDCRQCKECSLLLVPQYRHGAIVDIAKEH